MVGRRAKERYRRLFPDEESKAAAFDKIAERYFDGNFGTLQKAEIDLLLFSEYLDRVYADPDFTESDVSDYALARDLGRIPSICLMAASIVSYLLCKQGLFTSSKAAGVN